MLVLTSVIATETPGSGRPAASTMLPSSSPLTACADASGACASSSRAAANAASRDFVIVSLPKLDLKPIAGLLGLHGPGLPSQVTFPVSIGRSSRSPHSFQEPV